MAFAATLLVLVSAAAPILAGTGSFTNTEFLGFEGSGNDGVCTVAVWRIYAEIAGTVGDYGGDKDTIGWIIVDAVGNIVNWDAENVSVGSTSPIDFTYSPQANQVLPVTINLIDPVQLPADEAEALAAPVIASMVFDAADFVPSCAQLPHAAPAVGSAACPNLPSGAVVGSLPNATRAYYRPGNLSTVTVNPGTYWVIGVDESGAYYKIMLACQFLWLPIESMQPSYQAPQNGAPLPTNTVS